jgi:hypothetical protein
VSCGVCSWWCGGLHGWYGCPASGGAVGCCWYGAQLLGQASERALIWCCALVISGAYGLLLGWCAASRSSSVRAMPRVVLLCFGHILGLSGYAPIGCCWLGAVLWSSSGPIRLWAYRMLLAGCCALVIFWAYQVMRLSAVAGLVLCFGHLLAYQVMRLSAVAGWVLCFGHLLGLSGCGPIGCCWFDAGASLAVGLMYQP